MAFSIVTVVSLVVSNFRLEGSASFFLVFDQIPNISTGNGKKAKRQTSHSHAVRKNDEHKAKVGLFAAKHWRENVNFCRDRPTSRVHFQTPDGRPLVPCLFRRPYCPALDLLSPGFVATPFSHFPFVCNDNETEANCLQCSKNVSKFCSWPLCP